MDFLLKNVDFIIKAMEIMGKTLRWWREGLDDMWNIVAVGGGVGNPATPPGSPQGNTIMVTT